MTRNQLYLILLVAFVGWTQAYPNKGAYVVTRTEDENVHHGLLGRNMCTRGPAYWCYNITQAKECNAMKHCIAKVWETPKEKLPEDNDSVCKVCLDMVKQARDQLLSNETQDELRQVLEGSCNLIPLKIVAKECDELADNFIPELIDALTSRMDPQMVCHVSGLCNSIRIDEMLAEMKEIDNPHKTGALDPKDPDTCPICEHYIGLTVNYLKGLTKADLRLRLLDVCGFLGSYSESCRMGVTKELDQIYDYLQNNAQPKQVCGLIGLCQAVSIHRIPLRSSQQTTSTNVRVWQPSQTANKDDLECDFCKQLTESLRQWLVANATQEEFEKVIDGLCKQTGKFKKECRSLAEQYGKQIYETLVEGFNPDDVCKKIGVCLTGLKRVQLSKDDTPIWTMLAIDDSSKSDDDDDSLVMMKLLPAEHLTGDDEMKPTPNAECQFCEYAFHYLQNYLDDAKTEDEIREQVDKLCDTYLPRKFDDQCKTFVKDYGDAIVNLLAQEVDPSEVCPRLKLCPRTKPITAVGHPVKSILPTCALCTFTIEKLISMVGKNMTKESIDSAMESVCTIMPKNIEDDCMSFMKNYGDQVAEMILIYGTSHAVCDALHLCLLSPQPPKKIVVESALPLDRYLPQTIAIDRVNQMETVKNDSPGCVMCEFVITTLDQRLQDNATEEEIKEEVEQICTYLPKTVKPKCRTFIETYGEMIIQYLSQELDPAQICTQMHLCQPQIKTPEVIRDLSINTCELCTLVAEYMSTLLGDDTVDKSIDAYVKKTCALVPKTYRAECQALIEDYGPYLLSLLNQDVESGKACAQLQLCKARSDVIEDNTLEVEY